MHLETVPNKGHNGWGKKSGILKRGKKNQDLKQKRKWKKKEKGGKIGKTDVLLLCI